MKTKGKIYISGKVNGVGIRELFQKFGDAETMLSQRGFEVINPLKLSNHWDAGVRWQEQLQTCLDQLGICTSIYMLPCAAKDEVAQVELQKAMEMGIDIYYELENVEADEPTENVHGKK